MRNSKVMMMFCCLLIVSNVLFAQNESDKPVRVFITAGQSNTDGRVKNTLLPSYIKDFSSDTTYQTGAYRYAKISQNNNDGSFRPYWPKGRSTEGLWTYDAVTYYGLEQVLQEDFYIVKWAVGGTSIGYPEGATKGRFWSADATWLDRTASVDKGGMSLLYAFTDAIDAAIDQTLSKLEQGYHIDAFLWHQGESDDRYGRDYYDNLKGVIRYVRNHLTNKTGQDYAQLPFVFGSIPKGNKNFNPLLDAAMQRIAEEDPYAYLIDLSNAALQDDKLHFTAATATYFGEQVFKTLDRLLRLSKHDFRIARYKDDKDCAISYTFDDGLKEHYTLVAPQFRKLGFKGTFWINGGKVNDDPSGTTDTTRVTWADLRQMAKEGHEISNHGWAHRNFGRHTLEEIKEDVFRNDSVLFAQIGVMPRTFCYPNNKKTPEGFALVNKNRVGTRLLQRSIGGKATHENLEKWVQDLIDSRGWGIGMTHGITYGYDHFSNPTVFWDHLQKVKAQEDKIWVDTFVAQMAYMKAYKAITYEVSTSDEGYVIKPHLTLDSALYTELLTGVIDRSDVKRVRVWQGEEQLHARIFPDKILFDFDPFGGDIQVSTQY